MFDELEPEFRHDIRRVKAYQEYCERAGKLYSIVKELAVTKRRSGFLSASDETHYDWCVQRMQSLEDAYELSKKIPLPDYAVGLWDGEPKRG